MFRKTLSILVLCGMAWPVQAQLDPELQKPYQVHVALRIARHKLLTPVFRDRLERELRDSLRAALGAMGRVEILDMTNKEVLDRWPILREVEMKGLQQGLDTWREVSEVKTHFILVDYVDGAYELQARQHDGLTGMASPSVRRLRTTVRELVGRSAALMVDQDFGLVGTLPADLTGPGVAISIKGGDLGVPLEHWINKGDVFTIAQIRQGSGGQQSLRAEWALLQVIEPPSGGICKCQFYHRYELLGGPGVLGYRCLKVATDEQPLRMRLVRSDKPTIPVAGRRITLHGQGFDGNSKEESVTNSDGRIESQHRYRNVVFVNVVEGNTFIKIPVAILDDRTIVCPVGVNKGAEQLGQLEVRKADWLNKVYDQAQVQVLIVKELNGMVRKSNEEALQRARKAQANLKTDLDNLNQELAGLRDTFRKAGQGATMDLSAGERQLQDLQVRREGLATFIENVEKILKQENDPKRKELQTKITQANQLEREAEFDKAIQLYEQVLADSGENNSELLNRLNKLKKEWTPKDDTHRQARHFIYTVWAQLPDATQINQHLADARKSFQTCKEAGDRLTLQRLQMANVAHVTKLQKEIAPLTGQPGEDAQEKIRVIGGASDGLQELIKQVGDFLDKQAAKS